MEYEREFRRRATYYVIGCIIAVISCLVMFFFILPSGKDSRQLHVYPERPLLLKSLKINCGVKGVTQLDGEIYVVCRKSDRIRRFSSSYEQREDVHVNGLIHPHDIAACRQSKVIYVADYDGHCIWRMTQELEVKKFISNVRPLALSVTSRRLLVTSHNELYLYRADGEQLKQVSFPDDMILLHAVETKDGTFVVSYSDEPYDIDTFQAISEVDMNGHVIRTSTESLGWDVFQAWHLALDDDGRVIVADRAHHRILLMNKQLQLERVLLSDGHSELELEFPEWLSYIPETKVLLVGLMADDCVLVYSLQ